MKLAITILFAVLLILINGVQTANAEESSHSRVVVFSNPPFLLADGVTYDTIVVQLLDTAGKPMKAAENVSIFLSSSNTTVGTVQTLVHIKKGSSYTMASFATSKTPGNTTITAIATGYEASSTKVTTTTSGEPQKLVVYAIAPIVIANNETYGVVVVQLQNHNSSPARAPTELPIFLSSSSPSVGKVESNATIPAHDTYALVPFHSTFVSGTTTITAITSGYRTGSVNLMVQDGGLQDFALTVETPVGVSKPGETVMVAVKTDAINSLSGPLELLVGDVPKNATTKFTQNPISVSEGTTLEITIPKAGVYNMAITAKAAKIAHTKSFKIKVGGSGDEVTDFASFYRAFASAFFSFDPGRIANLLTGYPLYFAPVGIAPPAVGFAIYKKKLPLGIFSSFLRREKKDEE